MIAKWFKFQHTENKGWIGLAVAATKKDLFHQIDEHGDPYQCDLISVPGGGSLCLELAEWTLDGEVEQTNFELSERMPMFDDPRWKPAKWDK